MDLPIEKLEKIGLEEFIDSYWFYLCKKTINQTQIAGLLQFDFDQSAKINAPPDNFSKCEKLYELIQKTAKVRNFLEALDESGNEHILKFINETDFSTASTSANRNRSRGIWFNIPEPIDSFCGREEFLTQLHDQLKPRDDAETEVTVLSQVKIVSGLGGIGKTETARKYITKQRKLYNNFIWIDAETENSMRNSFLKLAEEIKIPVKNAEGKSREIQEIVKEIYNKICDGGKSNLIVFDNAEDYLSCRQFFPFGLHPDLTKPVILATSRNQDWISPTGKIQVLPLDKMTDDESLEFILKQLEIPESEIPEFREESKEFIELIGGLPLALQQAVAYIKQETELTGFLGKSYKISDYVKEFKLSMKKYLAFSPVPPPDSSPTVFVTWNVTFEKIQKLANGNEAVKILEIISFLHADKIPSTFLHDLVPEIKDAQFSGALKLLNKYSLINYNVRDFCLSIHRQLQFVILQYLKECNDVSNVVMNIVGKSTLVLKSINLSKSSDVFLNVHQIVNNSFDLIQVTEKVLVFMGEFGGVLWQSSRFSESLELCKKVYSKRRELLGENHEATLTAQHNMAIQLSELGRYKEALTLYKEILEKREIHPNLGVDHPFTITTKHSIAAVLLQQEKYDESLELFQQVLAQSNKIHGENHQWTLTTQKNVATVHVALENFSQALTLFEQVEKKQTAILGPHHKDLFQTKHAKAAVLFKMGQFEEAAKIFNEVCKKQKEILGENHLETIETLNWIGVILEKEGKLEEALDIFKKVYEGRKANLGPDHPNPLSTKYHIANMLEEQEKYAEALELFGQILAQKNKIHGENHPSTLTTQNHIASLHSDQGDFSKALDLYEEVEKIQTEIFGPHHSKVLRTKHNKATTLSKMGQFEDAFKILSETYEKEKAILGENHVDTLKTLKLGARMLEKVGTFKEGFEIYQKMYEIRKSNLGVDHPDTVITKHNLGEILRNQEKYGEALEMFEQALAQRTKIHGENHPLTLYTQTCTALVHLELGSFSEALTLFQDLEKKETQTLGPHHRRLLQTKRNKAGVLFKMGQFEEASTIFKEVYEEEKKAFQGTPLG